MTGIQFPLEERHFCFCHHIQVCSATVRLLPVRWPGREADQLSFSDEVKKREAILFPLRFIALCFIKRR